MGGAHATSRYVVGPFTDHFAVRKAQWRSSRAISKAFDAALGKKSTADRFIPDVAVDRRQQVREPGFTIPPAPPTRSTSGPSAAAGKA